ncbi:MAG: GxxExxY protein [Cyclobacteriaceae bacterium]
MIKKEYLHSELTGKIIGCAMEVHKALGNGFQEVIYQRALSIEMNLQNLDHVREQEMNLQYKGHDIGTRRVDFFVEGKVMVEIKAVIKLEDVHLAQAINYLEAYGLETGLLINFGSKSLDFKRVMHKLGKNQSPSYNQTNHS